MASSLSLIRRENFVPAVWPKELAKRAMWDTDVGLSRLPTIRVASIRAAMWDVPKSLGEAQRHAVGGHPFLHSV
jgi:hypothetical protein